MTLVITGNMIGAGILAIPVNTGLAGLAPAMVGIVGTWLLMTITALILADQKSFSAHENADLPSFFKQELGSAGRWIAIVANLLILNGMLVAYMSGIAEIGASILKQGAPTWAIVCVFFLIATGVSIFGMKLMSRGNAVFITLLWIAFIGMIVIAAPKIQPALFHFSDWPYLPAALPVVITAFYFHNIIPSVCHSLNHNQADIRRAIWAGALIGLIMNVAWMLVAMGTVPIQGSDPNTLMAAFSHNLPATIPMSHLIGSRLFTLAALTFAALAIFTSYITNAVATIGFWSDLTARFTSNRWAPIGLAVLPPFIVALVYPDIFIKAVNLVGGVGVDLLFGILPGILLVRYGKKSMRVFGMFIVLAFLVVLIFEIGQELGWLAIAPDVESWNASMTH